MLSLKKFTIEKLNGDQRVLIDFIDNKKVVVAENGSGKTTIMNILFYCLKNNIKGLQKYDFENCILEFDGDRIITFSKNKLNEINNKEGFRSRNIVSYSENDDFLYDKISLIMDISDSILKNNGILALERFLIEWAMFLKEMDEKKSFKNEKTTKIILNEKKQFLFKFLDYNGVLIRFHNENYFEEINRIEYQDLTKIYMLLGNRDFIDDYEFQSNIDFRRHKRIFRNEFRSIFRSVLNNILKEGIKDIESEKKILESIKIMFLPTYRRIEQDSIELLSGDISIKEDSILSFGVADVSSLFNKISDKLNSFAKDSFNKINSSALNDLISGDHEVDYSIDTWQEEDYFISVLERVGSLIAEENKLKLKLIYTERSSQDKFLLKLIRKMCEIYDIQLMIEDEINNYINVCNKYLFNKKFYYDKKNLKIQIFKNIGGEKKKEISLSSLSSGEKQIISLFAKLYLLHLPSVDLENLSSNNTPGYWILFDEPELSLSVKWQEMLLPDILNSKRCDFLFATTHSPFIFDNELEYYTSDINLSIKEVGND